MEVGQLIQLCDVVPTGVWQPADAWVIHLILLIKYLEAHQSINGQSNYPFISVSTDLTAHTSITHYPVCPRDINKHTCEESSFCLMVFPVFENRLFHLKFNKGKPKCLCRSHQSSSKEEVILVHVEFAGHLQDFGAHLEAEEQLVNLKQTTARVPEEDKTQVEGHMS